MLINELEKIHLNQNIFVTFKNVATGKELVFLIDTGADISIRHIAHSKKTQIFFLTFNPTM